MFIVTEYAALREVPNMKRDAIDENHCLFQLSAFDVLNCFSIMAMPLNTVIYLCTWK